jgi:hypothetical protein
MDFKIFTLEITGKRTGTKPVGALLQGKEGDDLAEIVSSSASRSGPWVLSVPPHGHLANFTLSKRREILEKSSVSESLHDSLLRSPLSDKVLEADLLPLVNCTLTPRG